MYGAYAVICGMLAPFFWTFKAFITRKVIEDKSFPTWDLAIDQQFFAALISLIFFVIYLMSAENPLTMKEFLGGQITGVFFTLGTVTTMNAFLTGPGGPINALICTQIVYQTVILAVFFGQEVSVYELIGVAFGISASIMITLCDKLCSKEK